MTECPKCKGYGIVGSAVPDILRGRGAIFSSNECDMCHGSGEVEQTNEEYIRTCSTAELVHVIHLMTTSCYVCGSDGVDYRRCYFRKQCTGPKEIEEWLKEPHTPKE